MPGLGLTGCDDLRKKHTGQMDDPMTGEKNKLMKIDLQLDSATRRTFTMFGLSQGKEKQCLKKDHTWK